MKCLATATKAFLLAAALLQCLAPLAHATQDGDNEANGVLRGLRGLPTELRDLCLSYRLYRYRAEDAGLQLYHPEMFASHVRWEHFEPKDASPHIRISEGGKTIQNTNWGIWRTARVDKWVSSSGSASGTVTRLSGGVAVCVGVILRGQRDMNKWIGYSGPSWYYGTYGAGGCIGKGGNSSAPGSRRACGRLTLVIRSRLS